MSSESVNRLVSLVEEFSKLKALVIGDVIIDRYLWGSVDRISPEAPVPVVAVNHTEDRLGGAGNAAHNLTALGAKSSLLGVTGTDPERESVHALSRTGLIDTSSVISSVTRPTTLKTRVMGSKQQLLRIDRESTAPCVGEEALLKERIQAEFRSYDCVIISDYGKGVLFKNTLDQILTLRSINSSIAPILTLDPHPSNFSFYKGYDLAKPNRKEAEAATGCKISDPDSAVRAALLLSKRWECKNVIVSLSEGGLVVSGTEGAFHIPAIIRDVFDVSGAGDTLTAVATLALGAGGTILEAALLAIIAASNVVGKLGTATVSAAELCHDIVALSAENKLPSIRHYPAASASELQR